MIPDTDPRHPLAYKSAVHNSKKLQYAVVILYGFLIFIGLGFILLNPLLPYFGTKYSAKFSWEKFETIGSGTAKNEIIELLGEPIVARYPRERTDFFAYQKGNSMSYWIAFVEYDQDGIVLEADWIEGSD